MSNRFPTGVLLDVRRVGALVGAGFGLVVMVAGLVFADGTAQTTTLLLGVVIGVSLEEISGLVGHSSTDTTRAIYLHLLPNGKLGAASKLDHLFEKTGT